MTELLLPGLHTDYLLAGLLGFLLIPVFVVLLDVAYRLIHAGQSAGRGVLGRGRLLGAAQRTVRLRGGQGLELLADWSDHLLADEVAM